MDELLDLFCGMGGLAAGFAASGFNVTGVDKSEAAGQTFEKNHLGSFVNLDLSRKSVTGKYDIVTGGPPCRPWSSVNTVRRGEDHKDYGLVGAYFKHVFRIRPKVFIFENVLPARKAKTYQWWMRRVQSAGYSISPMSITYSEFGAPTKRRRFVVIGALDRKNMEIEDSLRRHHREPQTVRSKIWSLRAVQKSGMPDHVWPELKTIERYRDMGLYDSGKYGWYKLRWDEPAPSFGNVMKTYILHPDSFNGGGSTRVISIREALLIMGFDARHEFPDGLGLGARYQMIADSVSPMFSAALARSVRDAM